VRTYVPATLASLGRWVAAGRVPADGDRFVAEDETEEAEYDALATAADAAGELLEGRGRRVVVVADVTDPDAAFPLSQVVAVHADTGDVDPSGPDLPDLLR
jgi:hypothetical protein